MVGSIFTLLFRASSKFRLIYCFFSCKIMGFFIEKVHILRITHFSETTKDRNLIFGMGGDANVKLCIQHFLMVEIPTPKPYIFMIRVNRKIKCPKSWDHPHLLPEVFWRITHISETILSILTKLNVPWVINPLPKLFFSFLLIYKTRPNDFDLQLSCCISDAFSIFLFLA